MKKNIRIIAIVILMFMLAMMVVACGVPNNYVKGMEKMEGKGYSVSDVTTLSVSGSYLAFKATDSDERMTAVYFPKSTESKTAEDFYAKTKNNSSSYTVKKTTAGNFILVYYGTDKAVKDFEK